MLGATRLDFYGEEARRLRVRGEMGDSPGLEQDSFLRTHEGAEGLPPPFRPEL